MTAPLCDRIVTAADDVERLAPLPEDDATRGRRFFTLIVVCDIRDVSVPAVVDELARRRGVRERLEAIS